MKKKSISLFSDLFDDNFSFFQMKSEMSNLRTNIIEDEKDYKFEINVAGVKKEDISIDMEEQYLIVSINENSVKEQQNENYLRKEIVYKNAKRKYFVGNVKENSIKASLKDGILHIIIPKNEELDKSNKIQIDWQFLRKDM